MQGLRALLLRALAQSLAQLLRRFELGHRFSSVHLGALHAGALCRARGGAEQQALACAHNGPTVCVAVKAFAQPGATLGLACTALAAVGNDVAQRQFRPTALAAMGCQAHAQLALAVVDQPLAGAAPIEVRQVPARDGANVVGTAVLACGPRQVVLAVVQLADDDGAVDVAINKVHQHFSGPYLLKDFY